MAEHLAVVVPAFNEEDSIERVLQSLHNQKGNSLDRVFMVNNASTDNTVNAAEMFASYHPDFPLTIIDEPEQGTGSAADTGFLRAIDEGYELIARTDGDTQPTADWSQRIVTTLNRKPHVQLLGGSRLPLKDESYRPHDALLWPIGMAIGDLACRLLTNGRRGRRIVAGHNMATRAEAYETVGGFPRTRIEDADEDAVYAERVVAAYGIDAVEAPRDIQVRTSMRRLRRLGYVGYFGYRFDSLVSDGRRTREIESLILEQDLQ